MIEFDNTLWRPYSHEAAAEVPFDRDGAFAALFQSGSKKLTVISAKHTTDPSSNTFQTIDYVIDQKRPNCVIVEHHASNIPADYLEKWAKEDPQPNETRYALRQASQKNIDISGGEATLSELCHHIVALPRTPKYTAEDFHFFHMGDHFFHHVISKLPQEEWPTYFDNTWDNYMKNFRGEAIPKQSYSNFLTWLDRNHTPLEQSTFHHPSEFADPSGINLSNALNNDLCQLRDRHLTHVIREAFQNHDHVCMVYGGGHFTSLKPVLAQAMGLPTYEQINLADPQNPSLKTINAFGILSTKKLDTKAIDQGPNLIIENINHLDTAVRVYGPTKALPAQALQNS